MRASVPKAGNLLLTGVGIGLVLILGGAGTIKSHVTIEATERQRDRMLAAYVCAPFTRRFLRGSARLLRRR